MLRQEVYALDGTEEKEAHPYVVTEQNFTIRMLQPEAANKHAVFFTHAREALTYQYERNPEDPRIGHTLTLEVDDFGNVLKSAAVGYGRRQPDPNLSAARPRQASADMDHLQRERVHQLHLGDDVYRTPLPCEVRSYELTGLALSRRSRSGSVLRKCSKREITPIPIAYEAEPSWRARKAADRTRAHALPARTISGCLGAIRWRLLPLGPAGVAGARRARATSWH